MRTVTIKMVIDDEDEEICQRSVQNALDTELNSFPLYYWDVDKANDDEERWKEKYDSDKN